MGQMINTLRKDSAKGLDGSLNSGACGGIGASNGPAEAVNGRLDHMGSIALGFSEPQPPSSGSH